MWRGSPPPTCTWRGSPPPRDRRRCGSPGGATSGRQTRGRRWCSHWRETENGGSGHLLRKHKRRIVFSDVVFKNRWSDVNSADLISLKNLEQIKELNLRATVLAGEREGKKRTVEKGERMAGRREVARSKMSMARRGWS
ncbi:hypothetical protein Taro_006071 [Colocasia esculenta]|uniref:Uncharacterized protein n=1 Tax=Colocasia esculenta TaxID=4460 RepID=A0A843TQ13_COLES|nr:hypothetical protein [Colocasia esculenta]